MCKKLSKEDVMNNIKSYKVTTHVATRILERNYDIIPERFYTKNMLNCTRYINIPIAEEDLRRVLIKYITNNYKYHYMNETNLFIVLSKDDCFVCDYVSNKFVTYYKDSTGITPSALKRKIANQKLNKYKEELTYDFR